MKLLLPIILILDSEYDTFWLCLHVINRHRLIFLCCIRYFSESSANEMDIDAENVRYASGETSVGVAEAEPLNSKKSSRDHQTASRHREDPESDDMLVEPQVSEGIIRAHKEATARETICTIVQRLEDPESDEMLGELQASGDIRRAQEEETVRETICTVMQRLEDPHESPGDNLHRDGHMENSESEKTWVEKTPHDGSLPSECKSPEEIHRSEDQPSGDSRIDGEKESTREEPEPEPGSMSKNTDLPEGIEKHRGHSDGEMTDTDIYHGSHKKPYETPEVNQVGHNVTEKGFLSDVSFSEEGSKGSNAKDTPVAATPKPASWLKISEGGAFLEINSCVFLMCYLIYFEIQGKRAISFRSFQRRLERSLLEFHGRENV